MSHLSTLHARPRAIDWLTFLCLHQNGQRMKNEDALNEFSVLFDFISPLRLNRLSLSAKNALGLKVLGLKVQFYNASF